MEDGYDMNHKYRGQALIIGNDCVDSFLEYRASCELDLDMMEELFTRLDFLVIRRKNLEAREMIDEMRTAARHQMNEDSDCFVMVISTHGIELYNDKAMKKEGVSTANVWQNAIFGQKGCPVFVDDIVKIFLDNVAPGLRGKPKLFFIQACRSRLENLISNPKYDFGHVLDISKEHWTYSNVDVRADVDDLFGEHKVHEDNLQDNLRRHEGEREHVTNLSGRRMEDGHGDAENILEQEMPFDIVPVNCPNDFLFMYPALPGKTAISDSFGSLLLKYMHRGENLEKLLGGDSLLRYLTYVSGDMAAEEYEPDLVMESKTEEDRLAKLRNYMKSCTKKLSEDKNLLIRELGPVHSEQLRTKTDIILVEEYLKNHLNDFTAAEMQGVLKHLMPIKLCACIIHRLRGNIFLTPKTKKSPMAKLINYFRKKFSPRTGRKHDVEKS